MVHLIHGVADITHSAADRMCNAANVMPCVTDKMCDAANMMHGVAVMMEEWVMMAWLG